MDPYYAQVAHDRLEYWLNSGIYRAADGLCQNDSVEHCSPDALVCHYMTPSAMTNFTKVLQQQRPHLFRNISTTVESQISR